MHRVKHTSTFFNIKDIVSIIIPNKRNLWGRLGFVRIKRNVFVIFPFVSYLPPVDKHGQVREVTFELISEIERVLDNPQAPPHSFYPHWFLRRERAVGAVFR